MRWRDIEEIVQALEENYAEEDVHHLKLSEVEEMVISLKEFEDQETSANKETLNKILEAWIELREEQ